MKKKIFTLMTLLLCLCSGASATITAKWDWKGGKVATGEYQNTTTTISSDVSGVSLFVDATNGKLTSNSGNAQFNVGTKLQVPVVSTNDVVTVVANSYNFVNIKIGGNTYMTQSTTYNVTATDVIVGYVEIESTSSPYLNSIQVQLAYMPATKVVATWNFQNCTPSSITSTNIQGKDASGTVASDIDGLKLSVQAEVEGTNIKLAYDTNGYAQFNQNTSIHVPVSSVGDVVTVVSYTGQYHYTVGGVAATANTTTYSPNATDVNNGYVNIVATATAYIYSITLTMAPNVTIGSTGWATFSNIAPVDFTNLSGVVSASIVTGNDGNAINTTAVTGTVAAGTGLLLSGAAGTYSIPVATTGTDYSSSNELVAVSSETTVNAATESGYKNYVLALVDDAAVFQYIGTQSATVGAGKAYLHLPVSSNAPSADMFFIDQSTTGINKIETQEAQQKGEYYNLAGQRVALPTKGLYIVNGKKIIVR